MFSGIVEETGIIQDCRLRQEGGRLIIGAQKVLDDVELGASISVNGVCLTVTHFDTLGFEVQMAPETLRRTTLGLLQSGHRVNLERALSMHGRVGGHVVQGHVDTTGVVLKMQPDGDGVLACFQLSSELMRYVVPKGYIAVDGMSLTVVDTGPDWFTISLIPHTRSVTVAGGYAPGRSVNIEVDILGKYIEKLLAHTAGRSC